jgi:hypothetical protein
MLLWRFTATAWKCAKTSPRTLATSELTLASRQCTVSHLAFNQGIFDQKQHDWPSPPIPLFSVFPSVDKIRKAVILTQFRWYRQNRRRCWRPSKKTISRIGGRGQERSERCILAEGDCLEGDVWKCTCLNKYINIWKCTSLQLFVDVTAYTKGRGIDPWAATLSTGLEIACRLKSVTSARGQAYLRRGAKWLIIKATRWMPWTVIYFTLMTTKPKSWRTRNFVGVLHCS